MPAALRIVSTLTESGESMIDQSTIIWRYPDASIFTGSYITVESNEMAVVKSRGAVLAIYGQGQYKLQTPDKPITGFIMRELYGGTAPWLYEVLFINLARLVSTTAGTAYTKELAEVAYDVTYYFHVSPNQEDVIKLIQNVQMKGHKFTVNDLKVFIDPVIDQAINQVIQQVSLKEINTVMDKLTEVVRSAVAEELREFGLVLDKVRVIVKINDEFIKRVLSMVSLGIGVDEAMLYQLAYTLAQQGVITTPNVLVKQPVSVLIPTGTGYIGGTAQAIPQPQQQQQQSSGPVEESRV